MKDVLTLRFLAPWEALDWAIVRFVGGALLVPHGWNKATGDPSAFAGALAAKGVPLPDVAAWLSIAAELVGGTLLALGLLTRPAALFVAVNMAVAVLTSHLKDIPKMGTGGGGAVEYPLLLLAVAVGALLRGGGRLSLDAAMERRAAPAPARDQRAMY